MERINGSSVSPDLFGAGKDGFKDGNKALGISATVVNAEFMNGVQEEIVNVIESAGLIPSAGTLTQMRDAIKALIKGSGDKIVRVASTVAINLAAPGANIDGVAMVLGDAFLDKDHATPALRGVYIWNGAAVPATRANYADDGTELTGGMIVRVKEGTLNADTNWQLTNNGVVTIGTTALTFKLQGAIADASEEFKGVGELATTTESRAGVDDTRFITPLKLASTMIAGVGQTWQDVSGSRAELTTYTNSTGRPIMILVAGRTAVTVDSYAVTRLTIDGVERVSSTATSRGSNISSCISAIIPNGSTYMVEIETSAASQISHWSELR